MRGNFGSGNIFIFEYPRQYCPDILIIEGIFLTDQRAPAGICKAPVILLAVDISPDQIREMDERAVNGIRNVHQNIFITKIWIRRPFPKAHHVAIGIYADASHSHHLSFERAYAVDILRDFGNEPMTCLHIAFIAGSAFLGHGHAIASLGARYPLDYTPFKECVAVYQQKIIIKQSRAFSQRCHRGGKLIFRIINKLYIFRTVTLEKFAPIPHNYQYP